MNQLEIGNNDINGYNVEIWRDDIPINPCEEFDELGALICWHNRYSLGNYKKNTFPDNRVFMHEISELYTDIDTDYLTESQFTKCVDKAYAINVILPLYLYDHGGLTMNTSGYTCTWDSGQVGYIYVSLDDLKKEYGIKRIGKKFREKIESYLISQVEAYDNFLCGDIYGYTITTPDGDDLDSCGGFFGDNFDKNGLSEYVLNSIERTNKARIKERIEKVKQLIKAHVPLIQRADILSDYQCCIF